MEPDASAHRRHPPAGAKKPLLSRGFFVREGGLEPPRPYGHQHLKLARLPFRHSRKVES